MDDAEEPAALAALTQDALQHVLGFVPVSECTTMCGVARDWRTAWRARLAAAHFVDLAGLPLDDNGLQTLLSRVASCRTLCLAECRDLSSAGITGALFHPEQPRTLRPSLSRLCSLSLRSTSIDAAAFSQVWALPGLASLDVDSCDELEESELCRQRLNGGGSMTSLSIARCSRLSGLDSLQVLALSSGNSPWVLGSRPLGPWEQVEVDGSRWSLPPPSMCRSSLTELDASGYDYLSTFPLAAVAGACPNLVRVSARPLLRRDISASWRRQRGRCFQVRVRLAECERLSDEGVEHLARGCARLASVDLSWCPALTSHSIVTLISRCRESASARAAADDGGISHTAAPPHSAGAISLLPELPRPPFGGRNLPYCRAPHSAACPKTTAGTSFLGRVAGREREASGRGPQPWRQAELARVARAGAGAREIRR